MLADGLTRSLRHAEYAVDCTGNGNEADHVLAAQAYDLVILDLGLPRTRRLRGAAAAASPGLARAGAGAHCARRAGRSRQGPGSRRRRLPDQAVRSARARSARARADPPRPIRRRLGAHARRAVLDTAGRRATLERRAARPLGARARRARSADAAQRPGRQQGTARRAALRLGRGSRRQRDRSLCAPPAAKARAGGRQASAPYAAWATCWRRRPTPERIKPDTLRRQLVHLVWRLPLRVLWSSAAWSTTISPTSFVNLGLRPLAARFRDRHRHAGQGAEGSHLRRPAGGRRWRC